MAYLPCDVESHRHTGRNVNVYLGLIGPDGSERKSGRFCGTHWNEIQRGLHQFEVDPGSGTLSDPSSDGLCLACFKPVTEFGWQVFITSYPAKNDRKDYWARVHSGCTMSIPLVSRFKSLPG